MLKILIQTKDLDKEVKVLIKEVTDNNKYII